MPDTVEHHNTTVTVLDDADDTITVVVTVLNTILALLASLDNLVTKLQISSQSPIFPVVSDNSPNTSPCPVLTPHLNTGPLVVTRAGRWRDWVGCVSECHPGKQYVPVICLPSVLLYSILFNGKSIVT